MEINTQLPVIPLTAATPKLPADPAAAKDQAAIKKAARGFEAMFLGMMMKSMRATVGENKLTGGGRGEETFRSLLDQQYADAAANGGGVGLAGMLERELTRQQHPVPPGGSHGDK
ncbi:rod-binding protein [Geomonas sp. Red32]|uniref:rod-binding protein n=1 Tax=Geomonas sp. Red32 TaxID=2912856 RepID=UPI00202CF3C3|nr:rod-binding protein [Geomonas sp. Red32]MCM0081164.1 rod-binding protein [Geomonas sp. Red32]